MISLYLIVAAFVLGFGFLAGGVAALPFSVVFAIAAAWPLILLWAALLFSAGFVRGRIRDCRSIWRSHRGRS